MKKIQNASLAQLVQSMMLKQMDVFALKIYLTITLELENVRNALLISQSGTERPV
jgi:hypothetical protein